MKHTTLYRKWRPRRFGSIIGQEPVVRTLRRAIETDRVAHAYLFSGPRGTGKTSTAKVLAMGLNCASGPTPEPDGTCESCRAIMNNSSLDVLEMDAASNRGIDEVRDLRDKVNLAPVASRMKVYIIDEVHMLTVEAFNALLKMLEEPPEHVIFVLATTEKQKVLPTIISRCQSFDFRRPGVGTLTEKLSEISAAEGIAVEPEALTVIAREGRGSFRDAEGLLDQLSSFAEGRITASMARELLGSVGPEALLETTRALHERRAADALRVVDRLSNEGRDLGQFVGELLSHLRNLMLLPYAPEVALAEVGLEERAPLEEQASEVPTAEVVRIIEALGDTRNRIKRGGDPKLELELSFLKLARNYTEPSLDSLLHRLEALELAVKDVSVASDPVPDQPQGSSEAVSSVHNKREVEIQDVGEQEESLIVDEGDDEVDMDWDRILRDLKERRPAVAAVYEGARLERFDGTVLDLSFPAELSIYVKLAGEPRRVESLQEILEEHLGTKPRLEFRVSGGGGGGREDTVPADESSEERALSAPGPESGEAREAWSPGGNGPGGEAETTGSPEGALGAVVGDGVIGDQHEVFEMARERFGSPQDGGKGRG